VLVLVQEAGVAAGWQRCGRDLSTGCACGSDREMPRTLLMSLADLVAPSPLSLQVRTDLKKNLENAQFVLPLIIPRKREVRPCTIA
jgi:hypothetical protein